LEGSALTKSQSRVVPALNLSAFRELRPMLAKSAEKAFDDPRWIFELKLDGYRALAFADGTTVRLISRAGNDLGTAYPAIADELASMSISAVLDGEIVVVDPLGVPRFELLQNYRKTHDGHLIYYVFDLLFLNGSDVRARPLDDRKEMLRNNLPASEIVRYVDHIDGVGTEFFELAQEQRLEGIMAKKKAGTYLSGKRVDHWLKIKCRLVEHVVIGGFTESRVNRKTLGALLVGLFHGPKLKYVGLVGTGLGRASELTGKLRKLETEEPTFRAVPKTDMPIHWVEPRLVCSVEFQEWTNDRILRGASFIRLDSGAGSRRIQGSEPRIQNPESRMQKQ
jgi:bifunctional non-homologous end joining protein LigD